MAPAAFREQDASVISIDSAKASLYPPMVDTTEVRKSRCRLSRSYLRLVLQSLTLTLGFYLRFVLPLLLSSSTSTLGFISSLGDSEVWASDFKVLDCFACSVQASTPASVFDAPLGFHTGSGLPCSLRLGPSASAGWGCACSAGGPCVGGRLNSVLMGNLPQLPCQGSSAVNKSCYTLVYCSYNHAEICRQLALQQEIGQASGLLKQDSGLSRFLG